MSRNAHFQIKKVLRWTSAEKHLFSVKAFLLPAIFFSFSNIFSGRVERKAVICWRVSSIHQYHIKTFLSLPNRFFLMVAPPATHMDPPFLCKLVLFNSDFNSSIFWPSLASPIGSFQWWPHQQHLVTFPSLPNRFAWMVAPAGAHTDLPVFPQQVPFNVDPTSSTSWLLFLYPTGSL